MPLLTDTFVVWQHCHRGLRTPRRTPTACHLGRFAGSLLFGLWVTLLVDQALAFDVQFDTPYLVACQDVTDQDSTALIPGQRVVEARFRVSSLLADTQDTDQIRFIHRFLSPAGTLQVVDYAPKSELSTSVVGNINVEQSDESTKALGLNVSGSFEHLVKGSGGADLGTKNGTKTHYELKPPTEVVLAAGTAQRGTGVYFKVRPSPDAPLEGTRDFVLRLLVDEQWRGGLMYVRCVAQRSRRDQFVTFGSALFVVTLYAAGDADVRAAGQDLVAAEARLRRAASVQLADIEKRSLPTFMHRVGAVLDMYDPRIPDHWLERLIFGAPEIDQHAFTQFLPEDVVRLARHYVHVKRRVMQYGT